MKSDHFTVIAFYEFRKIKSKFIKFKKLFNEFCVKKNIRGTVILSPEGINGTVAGLNDSINEFALFLNKLNFNNTEIKYSYTKIMPFYKLKIKPTRFLTHLYQAYNIINNNLCYNFLL